MSVSVSELAMKVDMAEGCFSPDVPLLFPWKVGEGGGRCISFDEVEHALRFVT